MRRYVPPSERKQKLIRPGCYLCYQSVCDECDSSRPGVPSVPPASYWQRGFEQGYAGELRPGYNMHLPGFAQGYAAGHDKRRAELEVREAERRELRIKDHQIARAVNDLTQIARKYGHTEQLRGRISEVVMRLVRGG